MWLNQRTVDAIRLMAELSARWPKAVKAAELAAITGITFLNVQKTAHALARAGLIEAERENVYNKVDLEDDLVIIDNGQQLNHRPVESGNMCRPTTSAVGAGAAPPPMFKLPRR